MKKLNNIISESLHRFLVKEGIEDRYVNIGIYKGVEGELFIFADQDYENNYRYKRDMEATYIPEAKRKLQGIKDCMFCTRKQDGSGRQFGLSSLNINSTLGLTIYPQYMDTIYADALLGEKKTQEDENKHNIFMENLNLVGGNQVLLLHDSNDKIMDGSIKYMRGKQNPYSNNGDMGAYFWGSKDRGSDPSNSGRYAYYCLADINDIYDYQNNMERFHSRQEAMGKYKYVASNWKETPNIIAVNTYADTPIHMIVDKSSGTRYDANWNKI